VVQELQIGGTGYRDQASLSPKLGVQHFGSDGSASRVCPGRRMGWRQALCLVVMLWGSSAPAQTLPWPSDQPPAGPPQASGTQQTLCTLEISQQTKTVEAFRAAARTATERKAKRDEVCQYLNEMAEAATRLTQYVVDNQSTCGLGPTVLAQIRDGTSRAVGTCRQICIVEPAAGRLDDVPPLFASPMRVAQARCGNP